MDERKRCLAKEGLDVLSLALVNFPDFGKGFAFCKVHFQPQFAWFPSCSRLIFRKIFLEENGLIVLTAELWVPR